MRAARHRSRRGRKQFSRRLHLGARPLGNSRRGQLPGRDRPGARRSPVSCEESDSRYRDDAAVSRLSGIGGTMNLVCLSPNGVDSYRLAEPPDAVLVATMDGVVRLKKSAAAGPWLADAAALKGLHVSSLMREPGQGMVFAGIHGTGLYRSRDNGATWESASTGIDHGHVFTLACRDTENGVELYAGTEPAHLYRSTDLGEHWRELPGIRTVPSLDQWNFPAPPFQPHVKHVAFDPRDRQIIYVCIEQGAVLKSDDGGETFRELHFQDETYALNQDTHRIIFNPRNPDEIFLPGGDGISTSRDAGQHWRHLTTPKMRVAYPDHFYVAPDEEHRLFAAGGGDPPNIWRETG